MAGSNTGLAITFNILIQTNKYDKYIIELNNIEWIKELYFRSDR